MATPCFENILAVVDFPMPMEPVSPIEKGRAGVI